MEIKGIEKQNILPSGMLMQEAEVRSSAGQHVRSHSSKNVAVFFQVRSTANKVRSTAEEHCVFVKGLCSHADARCSHAARSAVLARRSANDLE
jgi:hypothetical protein